LERAPLESMIALPHLLESELSGPGLSVFAGVSL